MAAGKRVKITAKTLDTYASAFEHEHHWLRD